MSSNIIALCGSLLIAGTIVVATKSAAVSTKQEIKNETSVSDSKAFSKLLIEDSNFVLPKSTAKFPTILIKNKEGDTASVPMRMSRVKMDVKVTGNISTTTLDITYCNDLDRILDGQFCFPLGEGQSISYFALDMDGKLREASVVEKAKGRQTYESVIRRKIDPALLEWTAGNNFRARVYPIPAKGCKRVIVGFEQELIPTGKSYVYYQPLLFDKKLEEFSVRAEVLNQTVAPKQLDENGIPLKFENSNQGWTTEKSFTNYQTNQPLAFEIPAGGTARNVFTEQTDKGNVVFYASLFPRKYKAEKKFPASICVLWDVSNSSDKRNLKAEINLLSAYIKKTKATKINLVTFSNEVVSNEELNIATGNTSSLTEKIDKLIYDGGTQFGALDLSKYKAEEFVLVSDGLSNYGESEIKTGRIPVHVLCSSPLSDYSYLKGIAQSTGGKFLNMQNMDSVTCMDQLSNEEYHFISAEYDKGMINSVYPSMPQPVVKNFSISGVLEGYSAEITLNFGIGTNILHKEKITVTNDAKDYKGMVKKMWAQKKLGEMDIFYEKNKDEITSLGKQYGIVTRNTSLLVLDRIEDYIEHKVEPKDPELKKQYLASVNQTKQAWQEQQAAHLTQVVSDFDELKTWYGTNYVYKKPVGVSKDGAFATGMAMTDSTVILNSNNISNATTTYTVNVTDANGAVNFTSPRVANEATELESEKKLAEEVTLLAKEKEEPGFGLRGSRGNLGFDIEGKKADIKLNGWNPNAPYMVELKKVPATNAYLKYIELKKKYSSQPSFFVDVSDYFVKLQDKKIALRVLSNIAEFDLENHQLLRVLAHRLQEMNENKIAISVYQKVLKIREEEPQSYRDLGLAYAQNKEYQKAVDMLCKVVNRKWDSRFPSVEAFVACEVNDIIATSGQTLQLDSLDKRLIKAMPCDVRVVINWDTDNCDMDLWVTDPHQEKCFYSYNLTQSGGKLSRDFTGGYGPEVFMIRKATAGNYKVQVNYYGTNNQGLTGPTTVQAELYTNWGRPSQSKKVITLRLTDRQEVIDIGSLAFTK
ncbi:MAG: DUF2135 domain-containing protein [Bacteroidia bacterium]|nr:DUF2135 domain-containing protein [Bacteroidia bacterium]